MPSMMINIPLKIATNPKQSSNVTRTIPGENKAINPKTNARIPLKEEATSFFKTSSLIFLI